MDSLSTDHESQPSPSHRCSVDLSEALGELYFAGNKLTIGKQELPDFRSAMIAVLGRSPSARKAIASRVSQGLGGIYHVSTDVNRKLWGYLQNGSANGNGNGKVH
ncbi:MAG: hypothetical protein ABIG34_05515 [Candidatus Peregrinibacteria bacterium]